MATAALGSVAGGLWLIAGFAAPLSNLAAGLWVAAVLLVLAGALRGALVATGSKDGPSRTRPALGTAAVLGGVFVIALVVRLAAIDSAPFGIWFDEGETGLEARRLLAGAPYSPLSQNFGREPSLYFYLVAVSFALFGESIEAIRGVTALLGALGAMAVALLGREIFGWRVGLAAGLLLAVDRWHLNFSRLGMQNVTAPMVAALSLWLAARAIRRGGWPDFVLAGLAAGLGFHAYAGFRLIFAVVAIALIAGCLLRRWPVRLSLARLGVAGGAAVLVGLPMLIFAARFPDEFNQRAGEVFLFSRYPTAEGRVQALLDNTRTHLLMFHERGDPNGRHNLPGEPMLDPVGGVLLVLGTGFAVWRFFDWRYAILLIWGLAALTHGILSLDIEAPQGARSIAATPVVALFAALGLIVALDRADTVLRRVARPSARGAAPLVTGAGLALAVGAIAMLSLTTYFIRQMPATAVWEDFTPRETILAREAAQFAPGEWRLLVSETLRSHPILFLRHPVLDLLLPGREIQRFDPVANLPLREATPTQIFLDDFDRGLWPEVARYYPDTTPIAFRPPREADPVLLEYRVTHEAIEARRGLEAIYQPAGASTLTRRDRTVDFDWGGAPPVPYPFAVEWWGGLAVPQTGDYTFFIPDTFTLDLDGRAFAPEGDAGGVRVHLAQGNHAIRLSGSVNAARPVRLLWQGPGQAAPAPVPAEHLFAGVSGGTGLLSTWHPEPGLAGQTVREQIDPVLAIYFQHLPLPRPYSVEWRGTLDAPASGLYRFGLDQAGSARLWIDGREILANDAQHALAEAEVYLTAGLHVLRVQFEDTEKQSYIRLYWTPPGGEREILPGRYLYPPPPDPAR